MEEKHNETDEKEAEKKLRRCTKESGRRKQGRAGEDGEKARIQG